MSLVTFVFLFQKNGFANFYQHFTLFPVFLEKSWCRDVATTTEQKEYYQIIIL